MTTIIALIISMTSAFLTTIHFEEDTVKAMSFYIRYGTANDGDHSWTYRKDMVFQVIDESDCDFIGLQEAMIFQIEEIIRNCPSYKYIGVTREINPAEGEATPILWNSTKWDLLEGKTLWLSEMPEKPGSKSWDTSLPRIFTWGRFVHRATKREVIVFNTHYDHRSAEARFNSSRLLVEYINNMMKGTGTILLGDFNAAESQPPIEYLTSNPTRPLLDVYRFLHAEPGEADMTFYGWDEHKPGTGKRLDYIFAAGNLVPLSAKVVTFNIGGNYPSDHMPVMAEFK